MHFLPGSPKLRRSPAFPSGYLAKSKPTPGPTTVLVTNTNGGISFSDPQELKQVLVPQLIFQTSCANTFNSDVKVSLIKYSGPGRTETLFHLDKHKKKDNLIEELFHNEATGGTTRTGEAIRYAVKEFANPKHGARKNAQKFIVVFTDGYSQEGSLGVRITCLRRRDSLIHR
ncbi:unnamed protein product [Angiostrongylus costaricensis]|uniref:VWFA domain-containing protein n=1 Tax=Angiostrongylus costaricensis TaxID=334426 RepID=A0A0R3PUC7_ANGCS|nr:unnamed protein product [Angiostrongylus costaricensis]